jgi:O-antigen ligase
MYLGVLAILILGALIVRFQPQGMARVLFATALAQVVVLVIALIIWKPEITSTEALLDVLRVMGVNGFFVVMWVGSGLLFQRADATPNRRLE